MLFPLRDDNPTRTVPYVTYGLVVVNVLVWFLVQGMGTSPQLVASVEAWGFVPQRVGLSLIGDWPIWHVGVTGFTSMFLHGGWFHLVGNMWFLWVFGDNVEDSQGHGRFLGFYLGAGLAAVAAQYFSGPFSAIPMVGASGAIGGVMGAYAVLYPMARIHSVIFLVIWPLRVEVPALVMLGLWFFMQLSEGMSTLLRPQIGGGVAFWAHAGGFLFGALLAYPLRQKRKGRRRY